MSQISFGKLLLIALGLFVVLGGGAAFVHSLLLDLDTKGQEAIKLRTELQELESKERILQRRQREYAKSQAISLPPDLPVANTRYRAFLSDLARKHNLIVKKIDEMGASQSLARSGGNLTPLTFRITLETTFPRLLAFLTDFYSLNLPHQIRTFTINPMAAGGDAKLEVVLHLEAAVLPGATQRNFLPALPDKRVWAIEVISALSGLPTGLAIGPSQIADTGVFGSRKLASQAGQPRDYRRVSDKNFFAGLAAPTPPQKTVTAAKTPDRTILQEVQLAGITTSNRVTEATLRNRITNKYHSLRTSGSLNQFEIKDEDGLLVLKGKVISITPRTVTFQVDGKNHVLELGQFLADALRREQGESRAAKADLLPASEGVEGDS